MRFLRGGNYKNLKTTETPNSYTETVSRLDNQSYQSRLHIGPNEVFQGNSFTSLFQTITFGNLLYMEKSTSTEEYNIKEINAKSHTKQNSSSYTVIQDAVMQVIKNKVVVHTLKCEN